MPQSNDLDNEVGKAAKLGGAGTFVTETARAKRARCPLKRKTRNILGLNQSSSNSLIAICASSYSTGSILEIQDSSTDSDSHSENDGQPHTPGHRKAMVSPSKTPREWKTPGSGKYVKMSGRKTSQNLGICFMKLNNGANSEHRFAARAKT